MGRKVLAAVDRNLLTDSPVLYGIQLASRIQGAVTLIVIQSAVSGKREGKVRAPSNEIDDGLESWFERLVAEGQLNGVTIEIFMATGDFYGEISRFAAFNPSVQFIVMAAPEEFEGDDYDSRAGALQSLRDSFEGEILLVQKAGHVTKVPDLDSNNPSREI